VDCKSASPARGRQSALSCHTIADFVACSRTVELDNFCVTFFRMERLLQSSIVEGLLAFAGVALTPLLRRRTAVLRAWPEAHSCLWQGAQLSWPVGWPLLDQDVSVTAEVSCCVRQTQFAFHCTVISFRSSVGSRLLGHGGEDTSIERKHSDADERPCEWQLKRDAANRASGCHNVVFVWCL
jgi:hypothetical protein